MDPDKKGSIFQKIYQDYLKELSHLDLHAIAHRIGVEADGNGFALPLFGKPYKVSPRGIVDPHGNEPIHSIKVVLCKYLLHAPASASEESLWVSYKDFKNAAPFVGGFQNNTEKAIATGFAGRLDELREACLRLGGHDPGIDLNYHLSMRFDALPNVPLLLLFNDADDEFPAQCLLLFERRAEEYLDMECLAILGWLLADDLHQDVGNSRTTIM